MNYLDAFMGAITILLIVILGQLYNLWKFPQRVFRIILAITIILVLVFNTVLWLGGYLI